MMNINIFDTDIFPYLEGEALVGLSITLTIADLKAEKMKSHKGREEEKYVLYFKENRKGFVLNKTNAKRIAQILGPTTGDWEGKQITISTEPVKAFGELHNALRVIIDDQTLYDDGLMNLEKLLFNLNKVQSISGFYKWPVEILDCRQPSATAPEADDLPGWRILFEDAKDYAREQIQQAMEVPEDADQPDLFADDPPVDDAGPGYYETTE